METCAISGLLAHRDFRTFAEARFCGDYYLSVLKTPAFYPGSFDCRPSRCYPAIMSLLQVILHSESALLSPFKWTNVADATILNAATLPWVSPSQRKLCVDTLLPGGVGLLLLLCDVFSSVRWPLVVRRVLQTLVSPFRDFLTLEDLEEPPHHVESPSTWKARVLVLGSALEAAVWIGVLTYSVLAGDQGLAVQATVTATTWVRSNCSTRRIITDRLSVSHTLY